MTSSRLNRRYGWRRGFKHPGARRFVAGVVADGIEAAVAPAAVKA